MKIKAKAAARELLDLLEPGSYCVHSSFESGFNLQAAEYLSFVGNKLDEKLPYGVLLKPEDTERLRGVDGIFRWSRERKTMSAGEIEISLADAAVYSSYYENRCSEDWNIDAVFGSVCRENTGLGCTIGDLTGDKVCPGRVDRLQKSFRCSDKDEIRKVLRGWVGAGQGLTPSGDDFLTGLLLVNRLRKILGDTFVSVLGEMACGEYTTAVSVNQYRSSLQGYFSSSMIAFADAYVEKNGEKLSKCVKHILNYGHTSGRDMAAGLYLGLITPVLH